MMRFLWCVACFCFCVIAPQVAIAQDVQGYEIAIRQVSPDGAWHTQECRAAFKPCKLVLPITAKDGRVQDMDIDMFADADLMYFQFLWDGVYVFQNMPERDRLYVNLPDQAQEQRDYKVSTYIPTQAQREDDRHMAVQRTGAQGIADLEIVIRIANAP